MHRKTDRRAVFSVVNFRMIQSLAYFWSGFNADRADSVGFLARLVLPSILLCRLNRGFVSIYGVPGSVGVYVETKHSGQFACVVVLVVVTAFPPDGSGLMFSRSWVGLGHIDICVPKRARIPFSCGSNEMEKKGRADL